MWLQLLLLAFLSGPALGQGFREVALQRHNYYRSLYGLSPLYLDYQLSRVAHAHATRLALLKSLRPSNGGYHENLWAYKGELRPLNVDARDAVNSWYTGSSTPGNTQVSIDHYVLRSNETRGLGVGIETNNDYSVVVAEYI